MSSKIIIKSIYILTMFFLMQNIKKNIKQQFKFKKIEQKPLKKYNCFLQPKELIQYKYIGSIIELKNKLDKNNIQYIISAIDHIYLCTKDIIDFEIRINKLNDHYLIQFNPIRGNLTRLIYNLIN